VFQHSRILRPRKKQSRYQSHLEDKQLRWNSFGSLKRKRNEVRKIGLLRALIAFEFDFNWTAQTTKMYWNGKEMGMGRKWEGEGNEGGMECDRKCNETRQQPTACEGEKTNKRVAKTRAPQNIQFYEKVETQPVWPVLDHLQFVQFAEPAGIGEPAAVAPHTPLSTLECAGGKTSTGLTSWLRVYDEPSKRLPTPL
jgi:hypothetical protein